MVPLTFDPMYWLLVGPAVLLSLWAQARVASALRRHSAEPIRSGFSGAEAAAAILRDHGLRDVRIEPTSGWLSDHYDPSSKTLRLSPDVFAGRHVAAVGVAAHEAGHALQDALGYGPLALRTALVPIVGFGAWLALPLIMFGAFLGSMDLATLGVVCFGAVVAFQLVTLPVEYDASARAREALAGAGVASGAELEGVEDMLDAAALTYVAATVAALAQLLYFMLRLGLLGERSRD